MAKFKISLKLTGLELSVEGSRDDVPLMTQAVGQQFAGLLMPASDIVEGEIVDHASLPTPAPERKPTRRSPRKRSQVQATSASTTSAKEEALDWRHDSFKWEIPQQDWVTADKSLWLLYVVANETEAKELTARKLAATFNKHFRQSGQVQTSHVSRDLGKLKGKTPATVSEDTTKSPSAWFLTQSGERRAQELVAKARGQDTGSDNG